MGLADELLMRRMWVVVSADPKSTGRHTVASCPNELVALRLANQVGGTAVRVNFPEKYTITLGIPGSSVQDGDAVSDDLYEKGA